MTRKTTRDGQRYSLDAAIALLIHNQAQFTSEMTDVNRRYNEILRRFANIEALLLEHERLLRALPDALKEKIGFQKA
jgi:hypothetical protein